MQKGVIEFKAVVEEALSNATFRVRLDTEDNKDHTVICRVSGKIRMNSIRILPGDFVTIEMTPYDLTKGRITYRHPTPRKSIKKEENNRPSEASSQDSDEQQQKEKNPDLPATA